MFVIWRKHLLISSGAGQKIILSIWRGRVRSIEEGATTRGIEQHDEDNNLYYNIYRYQEEDQLDSLWIFTVFSISNN